MISFDATMGNFLTVKWFNCKKCNFLNLSLCVAIICMSICTRETDFC